ncbi:MAG: hypothetical protein JWM44_3793 [Bacilli bacterium]|nr:hypothetical protein [Bacilli bacterium]
MKKIFLSVFFITITLLVGGTIVSAADSNQATELYFEDQSEKPGIVAGTIEFKPGEDLSSITDYAIYFTDASGAKLQHLFDINVAKAEGELADLRAQGHKVDKYSYFLDETKRPQEAVYIGVFPKKGDITADKGGLYPIWDYPNEWLHDETMKVKDLDPSKGSYQYRLSWMGLKDESHIVGYRFKYESGMQNGPDSTILFGSQTPVSDGFVAKKGNGETYELTLGEDKLPADAYHLWIYPVNSAGDEGYGVFVTLQDDISGTEVKELTPTSGIPFVIPRLDLFKDTDGKVGTIGGEIRWSIDRNGGKFDARDLSTDPTPLRFALYFVDADGKKMKGIFSVDRQVDVAFIPNGTPIPEGARAIGVFAEVGSAQSVNVGQYPVWDAEGDSGYYPKGFTQWDSNPKSEGVQLHLNWFPADQEKSFDEYIIFVGNKEEFAARVPVGKPQYNVTLETDNLNDWNNMLKIVPYKKGTPIPKGTDFQKISFNVNIFDWTRNNKDGSLWPTGNWQLPVDGPITSVLQDTDPTPGHVSFQLPRDRKDSVYSVSYYWSDITRRRMEYIGDAPRINKDSQSVNVVLPKGTLIPDGAVYIEASYYDGENHPVIYAVRDIVGKGPTFPDVDSNAKEAAAISDLAAHEIITGFSDGTFGGSSTVTRAQFAALLQRAFRLEPIHNAVYLKFSDISDSDWFSKAVTAATQVKLLKGNDDGTFRPDATITRAEMAVILARILAYASPEFAPKTSSAALRFDDAAEIPTWADESVARMQLAGLVPEGGVFGPTVQVTRTECAYMLEQMLQKLNLI